MNSKQMVFMGFIITSLITALVLAEALPMMLLAFLTLSLGLLLTYYWALSWKRGEYISKQRAFFRFTEELCGQKTADDIDNLLMQWAARVTGGAAGVARRQGEQWIYHGLQSGESISSWLDLAVQQGKTITIQPNAPTDSTVPCHPGAMLAIPLYRQKQIAGVFYMLKKEFSFRKEEVELLEWMIRLASRAYTDTETEGEEKRFLHSLMYSLLKAIESPHPEFTGHQERVASIASRLGEKLALTVQEQKELYYAALLHDAGKIPAAVQAGDDECEGIEQHTILGAMLLPDHPAYESLKQGIRYHHERYNGSGYPEGLKNTEIPLFARIIAVADIYDALTGICSEEERLSHEEAVTRIRMASGSGLDPLVIVALEEMSPLSQNQA